MLRKPIDWMRRMAGAMTPPAVATGERTLPPSLITDARFRATPAHWSLTERLLLLINAKADFIMAKEQDLQQSLDSIQNSAGIIATEVGSVSANMATLNQTIKDLQAQIGAGGVVTPQQLDALASQASTVDAQLKGVADALAPLTTPNQPPNQPPIVPPLPPTEPGTVLPAVEPVGGGTAPAVVEGAPVATAAPPLPAPARGVPVSSDLGAPIDHRGPQS